MLDYSWSETAENYSALYVIIQHLKQPYVGDAKPTWQQQNSHWIKVSVFIYFKVFFNCLIYIVLWKGVIFINAYFPNNFTNQFLQLNVSCVLLFYFICMSIPLLLIKLHYYYVRYSFKLAVCYARSYKRSGFKEKHTNSGCLETLWCQYCCCFIKDSISYFGSKALHELWQLFNHVSQDYVQFMMMMMTLRIQDSVNWHYDRNVTLNHCSQRWGWISPLKASSTEECFTQACNNIYDFFHSLSHSSHMSHISVQSRAALCKNSKIHKYFYSEIT